MNNQDSSSDSISDSDSMAGKVFVGLENEQNPENAKVKSKVGKQEVYKAFMAKAINTYFAMRFECGNPKFKQVITTIPMFRSLSILAKDYLVDKFEIIKMRENDYHPIVDVTAMDFFFCMEGRITLIFRKLDISDPNKINDTEQFLSPSNSQELLQPATHQTGTQSRSVSRAHSNGDYKIYLKANEYLTKDKVIKMCEPLTTLIGLQCETRSGKLCKLPFKIYEELTRQRFLRKDTLDRLIIKLNAMDSATDKGQQQFLNLFKLEQLSQGTVIAKEGLPQHFAYIILDGEVKAFKKMYKLESKDNEERDKEKDGLLQGQSFKHLQIKANEPKTKKVQNEGVPMKPTDNATNEEPVKKKLSEVECQARLQILSSQSTLEKQNTLGQQLGYVPLEIYIAQESCLSSSEMEYSLMVASQKAIVLKVSKYMINNRFQPEVKRELNRQQKVTIRWINHRGPEIIKAGFDDFNKDKKSRKLQLNNIKNYPVANRAAQGTLFGTDLNTTNENNNAKYLSFRRMNLKQKLIDDLNPAFVTGKKWEPTQVAKEYQSPKTKLDGYVTSKDLEQLQQIKDQLYGGINMAKHRSNTYKPDLMKDPKLQQNEEKIANLGKYNWQITQVKAWTTEIDPNYFEKKRASLQPQIRAEKKLEAAKKFQKAPAIEYIPREWMASARTMKNMSNLGGFAEDGALTQESSKLILDQIKQTPNNYQFTKYDRIRDNRSTMFDAQQSSMLFQDEISALGNQSLVDIKNTRTPQKQLNTQFAPTPELHNGSQASIIQSPKANGHTFGNRNRSMDLPPIMVPGSSRLGDQFQTPNVSPLKRKNPWNNNDQGSPINTMTEGRQSQVSIKYTADYIKEHMKVPPKMVTRNNISIIKNKTIIQPNITFYQDAAKLKGKDIEKLNLYKNSNMNPYATLDNKHKADLPPPTGDTANQLSQDLAMQCALKTDTAFGQTMFMHPPMTGGSNLTSIAAPPLQNEDVLLRMNRNRDKLDSIVSQYYFNSKQSSLDKTLQKQEEDKLPMIGSRGPSDINSTNQEKIYEAYGKFQTKLQQKQVADEEYQKFINRVVIRIQAMVRRKLAIVRVNLIKAELASATLSQRRFRQVQQERWEKEERHEFKGAPRLTWNEMQKDFMEIWDENVKVPRFEIHLNTIPLKQVKALAETISFGCDSDLKEVERVFCVYDKNVHLIHVCHYALSHEVKGYYNTIMKRIGHAQPEQHYTFIEPVHSKRLPDYLSLTQVLIYSAQSMKQILELVGDRKTYIVAKYNNTAGSTMFKQADINLSMQLGVPIVNFYQPLTDEPEPEVVQIDDEGKIAQEFLRTEAKEKGDAFIIECIRGGKDNPLYTKEYRKQIKGKYRKILSSVDNKIVNLDDVKLGTLITVLHADHPLLKLDSRIKHAQTIKKTNMNGIIAFEKTNVVVRKVDTFAYIQLIRNDGASGKIECYFSTQVIPENKNHLQAKENIDFVPVEEPVIFEHHETQKMIKVKLIPEEHEHNKDSNMHHTQQKSVLSIKLDRHSQPGSGPESNEDMNSFCTIEIVPNYADYGYYIQDG